MLIQEEILVSLELIPKDKTSTTGIIKKKKPANSCSLDFYQTVKICLSVLAICILLLIFHSRLISIKYRQQEFTSTSNKNSSTSADDIFLDITRSWFDVPKESYFLFVKRVPKRFAGMAVIGIDLINDSPQALHHLVMYHCDESSFTNDLEEWIIDEPGIASPGQTPCMHLMEEFAIQRPDRFSVRYQSNVGVNIGDGHFFAFSIHYNQPVRNATSGVRLFFQEGSTNMSLTHLEFHIINFEIPPRATDYHVTKTLRIENTIQADVSRIHCHSSCKEVVFAYAKTKRDLTEKHFLFFHFEAPNKMFATTMKLMKGWYIRFTCVNDNPTEQPIPRGNMHDAEMCILYIQGAIDATADMIIQRKYF